MSIYTGHPGFAIQRKVVGPTYCGLNAICEKGGDLFAIPSLEELHAAEEVVVPVALAAPVSTDTVRFERPHGHQGIIPDPDFTKAVDTGNYIAPHATPKKARKRFVLPTKP